MVAEQVEPSECDERLQSFRQQPSPLMEYPDVEDTESKAVPAHHCQSAEPESPEQNRETHGRPGIAPSHGSHTPTGDPPFKHWRVRLPCLAPTKFRLRGASITADRGDPRYERSVAKWPRSSTLRGHCDRSA